MANMKLIKYRVEKFKSIMDSGWIDCTDVTTLVGVNEAGKSNLLLALWKLNPAKGGSINFADDMPVTLFSELREQDKKPQFIHAVFEITSVSVINNIVKLSGYSKESICTVEVSRDYDGIRFIAFPNAIFTDFIEAKIINEKLSEYSISLTQLKEAGATEKGIFEEAKEMIIKAQTTIGGKDKLTKTDLSLIIKCFGTFKAKEMKSSTIRPFIDNLKAHFTSLVANIGKPTPASIKEVRDAVVANLPKFVYYSNYGNLDSEIYLPHVIENMNRTDVSGITEAKARTLKVLFEYVNLNPQEILEMGEDAKGKLDSYGRQTAEPTEEEIKEKAEKKKERDILLQSASSKLTRDFRDWWNQGNYTFDFSADGKHFRIWVSDAIRPERIVLENRSTGLQWFLSFYLVFLVESQDSHSGAILLLDEAGLSLHPLAQKDLSKFFNNLSKSNQIINTTHSPFIVDTDNIDRAKVVYVDKDGYTVASNDLRATGGKTQLNSVYAVHAALGLTISDIMLQGCRLVVVEGTSDQYYFNAIKLFLLSKNLISPNEEIVFVPAGGAKSVSGISSLLSSKNELPFVILDSDNSGHTFKTNLEKNLYIGQIDKIIMIETITNIPLSEVEDIIPYELLRRPLDRLFNNIDLDFSNIYDSTKPLIPQIEIFAKENGINLQGGYKVDLARQFKQSFFTQKNFNDQAVIDRWVNIFNIILENQKL